MGWSSGSYIAEKLWDELKGQVNTSELSKLLYETFTEYDADDFDFSEGSLEWTYYKLYEPEKFKEYTSDNNN